MTERATSTPLDDLEPAPVTEPSVTHTLSIAPDRATVVVAGTVLNSDVVAWAGGPVLEITLVDGADTLTLAFFGRRCITGTIPGRRLVARGVIGHHRGRRVLLNPAIWIEAHRRTPQAPDTHRRVPALTGVGRAPVNGTRGRDTRHLARPTRTPGSARSRRLSPTGTAGRRRPPGRAQPAGEPEAPP